MPEKYNHNYIGDHITTLQNTYSNLKVFSVVPMGVLMILYFFTFATLIDRGMYAILAVEVISTLFFVAAIIFINRWPVYVLKWIYRNKEPYNQLLLFMHYGDFSKPSDEVAQLLEQRRQGRVVT